MERLTIRTRGGLSLSAVVAGPVDGPLVVFLHGFPELGLAWHHQVPYLAARGFRAMALDQRGCGESDRPEGVDPYHVEHLMDDVEDVVSSQQRRSAHVVGHDWGGAIAWMMAMRRPECVERLVVLNMPHPHVLARAVLLSPAQALRSWYLAGFQVRGLPERVLGGNGGERLARLLVATSRPGAFSEATLARYRGAWTEGSGLTTMLNWYRAVDVRVLDGDSRVSAPTLLLWGACDHFLDRSLAQPSVDACSEARLVMLPEATHWLHHDAPLRVARHITEHLGYPR